MNATKSDATADSSSVMPAQVVNSGSRYSSSMIAKKTEIAPALSVPTAVQGYTHAHARSRTHAAASFVAVTKGKA